MMQYKNQKRQGTGFGPMSQLWLGYNSVITDSMTAFNYYA